MSNLMNAQVNEQISACIDLLVEVFGKDILGIYLYGSAVMGGLQKYSDIDLFVVANRPSTQIEKKKLIKSLLQVSGIYMKSSKPPIELTMVVKSEINPWRYPPHFDFIYGEWFRDKFESGVLDPWTTKCNPDLAIIITQISLVSKTLFGISPHQLLCKVPNHDFINATKEVLINLNHDLFTDTRNVLLTLARIWYTVETNSIISKKEAAIWAIDRLTDADQTVMRRALAVYIGDEDENWDDLKDCIKPCARFIRNKIILASGESTHQIITFS